MSSKIHNLKLNTGAAMPAVGLGCWMGQPAEDGMNQETYDMVATALKEGYRHIDTAFGYGNEEAVGKAIRDSGIPRSEIFVTTKLGGEHHDRVQEGFDTSFKNLSIDYVDLYLMHWPQAVKDGKHLPYGSSPTFQDTWADMEKLNKSKCKAIGVSNFSVKTLGELLETTKTVPAVNQVESSIYLPQKSLDKFCKEKGIVLTAYSPLGQPKPGQTSEVLAEPLVKKLAAKYHKSAGTVLVSWFAQRDNWTVVPKSANPDRIKANIDIFRLDQEDFDALSKVHEEPGKLKSLCSYGGRDIVKDGEIFGWTLDEMGWHFD